MFRRIGHHTIRPQLVWVWLFFIKKGSKWNINIHFFTDIWQRQVGWCAKRCSWQGKLRVPVKCAHMRASFYSSFSLVAFSPLSTPDVRLPSCRRCVSSASFHRRGLLDLQARLRTRPARSHRSEGYLYV